MASSTSGRKSQKEFKKQKELEEARKAGTIAPEVDENGREINPHIPQYIAQAPWYISKGGPSLNHQRLQDQQDDYDQGWYMRGAYRQTKRIKFAKGACENCGATTHTSKQCTDRPRKVGAKWTGKDIRPDEIIQQFRLDYDGKRDRWNGYHPEEHHKVIELYEKAEEEKMARKQEALNTFVQDSDPTKEKDEDEIEDELKEREGYNNAPVSKVDPKTRTTIRNLRIREDIAKYLHNLNPTSAYYDPKSRSMREDPTPHVNPEDTVFAGDNQARMSGDTRKFIELQLYSFEAYEKGQEIHQQAAPSQAELLHQEFKKKKDNQKKSQRDAIIQQYGGEEHLQDPSQKLAFAQTEQYVEYSRDGRVIKGQESHTPKSKYEEDVYVHNHTSVWGSYWNQGKWGYACCHQLLRNSYCTASANSTN